MMFGRGSQGGKGSKDQSFPQPTEAPRGEEALLIARSRRGETAAFNQLILLHQQAVYTLSYRMLGDPDNAADVTQEALFSAFRDRKSTRLNSSHIPLSRMPS